MKPSRVVATLLPILSLCVVAAAHSQDFRNLNLQAHGYATQAFIYSNQNNWNTINSTGNGSFRWTEGAGNLTAQPTSRLRLGAQARVFLLGSYGPKVTLDWASAEFKVNDRIGFRAGKIKSPGGLLNEIQDVDPAFLWTVLPTSIYPLASRNGNLAVRGGVAFGSIPLGESFGKIEYRAFGGTRSLAQDDGYFDPARSAGVNFIHGVSGPAFGGNLTWHTPVRGLLIGAADDHNSLSGDVRVHTLSGQAHAGGNRSVFYGRYEKDRFMVAGEYSRIPLQFTIQFDNVPGTPPKSQQDIRNFYVMTSYRLASKLAVGAYYSSNLDRLDDLGPSRYEKDWTVSGRYDFLPSLYLKLEQHFLDGTSTGFSKSNNPNGLQETSRLSLVKLGVTF